jgi:hypothetical protein
MNWSPAWDPVSLIVSWETVLHERLWQEDLSDRNWIISLDRSCCQETASEDCNKLRTLVCVCQWSVKCSSELCIQVVSKSNSSKPHAVYCHIPPKSWQYQFIAGTDILEHVKLHMPQHIILRKSCCWRSQTSSDSWFSPRWLWRILLASQAV